MYLLTVTFEYTDSSWNHETNTRTYTTHVSETHQVFDTKKWLDKAIKDRCFSMLKKCKRYRECRPLSYKVEKLEITDCIEVGKFST